jgi:hypothetical protein
MTDKPRPWPNLAKEARDRSAEEAAKIALMLEPVLDGSSLQGR